MAEHRDGENKLGKSIKDEKLKFSVEFDNGETFGHSKHNEGYSVAKTTKTTDHVTTAIEKTSNKGKQIERTQFHSESNSTKHHSEQNDRKDAIPADREKPMKKHHETTIRNQQETRHHGASGGSDARLPNIHRSRNQQIRDTTLFGNNQGGVRQSRERVGDSGQLPIQARIRGPGPARYLLPTTVGTNQVDCTKRHSPSFSFGSRRSSFKTDSPGPAYNIDLLGKTNGRSYSFGIKPKTPVRKNQSPGPGAYDTDVRPLWEKCAPQYSISPRTRKRSVDAVPSPSTYMLSSTLGANVATRRGGPAISIGGRSEKHGFAEDLAKTPGPAKYGAYSPSLTKRRSPEYTVKGRNFMPASKNVVPGPGAYSPQDVNTYLEQSPRHVIAIRHSEFMMPTMTQADI